MSEHTNATPKRADGAPAATCTVLTNEQGGTRLVYDLAVPATVQVEVSVAGDPNRAEPPTAPDALDAWMILAAAMRSGLPLPFTAYVGSRDRKASEFGTVNLAMRDRTEIDAWAAWAGAGPIVRRSGDYLFYGVWVQGWRGWHELEIDCRVEESDLTDAERGALAGGEAR